MFYVYRVLHNNWTCNKIPSQSIYIFFFKFNYIFQYAVAYDMHVCFKLKKWISIVNNKINFKKQTCLQKNTRIFILIYSKLSKDYYKYCNNRFIESKHENIIKHVIKTGNKNGNLDRLSWNIHLLLHMKNFTKRIKRLCVYGLCIYFSVYILRFVFSRLKDATCSHWRNWEQIYRNLLFLTYRGKERG